MITTSFAAIPSAFAGVPSTPKDDVPSRDFGSLCHVAAADSCEADKARADIVCDGKTDAAAINAAIAQMAAARDGAFHYSWGFFRVKDISFGLPGNIAAEHLIMRQCAAQRCAYGYVFGDVDFLEPFTTHSGNHPVTMENCCFEYCWYGITLGRSRNRNPEYVNVLTAIDLNAEEDDGILRLSGAEWTSGRDGKGQFGESYAPDEPNATVMGSTLNVFSEPTGVARERAGALPNPILIDPVRCEIWDVSQLFDATTCGIELVHPFYALDYPLFLTDRSVLGD